jgi:integrase
VTLGRAAGSYVGTLAGAEQANTRRKYGGILRRLVAEFGGGTGPDEISAEAFAAWFAGQWADRAPSTWNVSLDAVRSAAAYWQRQGWLAADFTRMLERRKPRPDRSRALSRNDVEELLGREDLRLRERTMWRMLYETAARSAEVLRLDVEDLDLANRKAKVRRKGGAIDVIVWQTGTARLLPRLLKGRKSGPLFLTDRRARVELAPCDVDQATGRARLSYRQAEDLFKAASARRHAAPAEALRADPRRGGRGEHADAHGEERAHLGHVIGPVRPAIGRGSGPLAGGERPGEASLTWRVLQLAVHGGPSPGGRRDPRCAALGSPQSRRGPDESRPLKLAKHVADSFRASLPRVGDLLDATPYHPAVDVGLVQLEVVGVLRLDIPWRQVGLGEVLVGGDYNLGTRLDGRSEHVPVIGIAQAQPFDERLVVTDQAVRQRGDHQLAQPAELFRRDVRSALADSGKSFVKDPVGPLRLHQACLRNAHQQVALGVAHQHVGVVHHVERHGLTTPTPGRGWTSRRRPPGRAGRRAACTPSAP